MITTTREPDILRSDVIRCAACKQDHVGLRVHQADHPIQIGKSLWPRWAMCPQTGKIIMLRGLND